MMIKKFFNLIDQFTEISICLSFATLCIVIFLSVLTRYILSYSLPWAEEIGRFLFLTVSYLGIILGMRGEGHLRVDVALLYLPKKIAYVCEIISKLVCIAFFLFIVWDGLMMTMRIYRLHQIAVSVPLPIWVVWAVIPFSALLTALQCCRNLCLMLASPAAGAANE